MPKPIPLRPALRIQMINVVVPNTATQILNLVLEDLAAEGGCFGNVKGEAISIINICLYGDICNEGGLYDILQPNHLPCLDFRCCGFDSRRGEEV